MKFRSIPAVLLALALALTACAGNLAPAPPVPPAPSEGPSAPPGEPSTVSLTIPAGEYRLGDPISALLSNQSDAAVVYGLPYTIEALRDGDWVELQWAEGKERVWILIAYQLEPGGETTLEFVIEQDEFDPAPEPGVYRLVKQVTVEASDSSEQEATPLRLTAEFVIAPSAASPQSSLPTASSSGAAGA
jgi:hypothetical protein